YKNKMSNYNSAIKTLITSRKQYTKEQLDFYRKQYINDFIEQKDYETLYLLVNLVFAITELDIQEVYKLRNENYQDYQNYNDQQILENNYII
ncbi:MAG: hypothetical protein WBA74_03095, partial [Cyclobacteriaceae bacterium]